METKSYILMRERAIGPVLSHNVVIVAVEYAGDFVVSGFQLPFGCAEMAYLWVFFNVVILPEFHFLKLLVQLEAANILM